MSAQGTRELKGDISVKASEAESHLEVEDAGVFVAEALTVRNHAMQQPFVQSQRADGGEQPAVSWKTTSVRFKEKLSTPSDQVFNCNTQSNIPLD